MLADITISLTILLQQAAHFFTSPNAVLHSSTRGEWIWVADETAHFLDGHEWLSQNLRTWSRTYINN